VSLHSTAGHPPPPHRRPAPRRPEDHRDTSRHAGSPRRQPPDFLTRNPLSHTWGEPHRPSADEPDPPPRGVDTQRRHS